jgi:hypothetical protein
MGTFSVPNGSILRWAVSYPAGSHHHSDTAKSSGDCCFMKKYLLIAIGLMMFALVCAIILFLLVSRTNAPGDSWLPNSNQTPQSTDTESAATSKSEDKGGGIPLSDVPLSDSQKETLEKAGVDTEEFVITEPMIDCAEEKLGDVRVAEIVAGAPPSYLEIAKLSLCLKAE